ncbi:MAG: tRNA (guanosine(37)-N1)-methyltransferase TrmD [Candidatus Levybacteria bacterium]|nr:tRNA (guanosine(37)-N1)-methyltransferase TrmD [Candidatus Levybacteria bacterium]
MRISILTLFPEMFKGPFDYSIIKKALIKNKVRIEFINIRDFGIGKHKVVDDRPYGGGHGMILRVDVLEKAIFHAKDSKLRSDIQKVILLSPHGTTFNQKKARELSNFKHLILVCGHYEGIDERAKKFIDEELSVGDFIVTGGEIPAMLVVDSIVRLISGVLKEGVTTTESFSPFLEYPQYTKPNTYKNLSVPPILLSGNHRKIKEWRDKASMKTTLKLRPDLLREK